MSLCSITGRRRMKQLRKRFSKDDRPFPVQRKDILSITGFRGNRVIYEDSWGEPDSEGNREHDFSIYGSSGEGNSYSNIEEMEGERHEDENERYDEMNQPPLNDYGPDTWKTMSSPDSGYSESFGRYCLRSGSQLREAISSSGSSLNSSFCQDFHISTAHRVTGDHIHSTK